MYSVRNKIYNRSANFLPGIVTCFCSGITELEFFIVFGKADSNNCFFLLLVSTFKF